MSGTPADLDARTLDLTYPGRSGPVGAHLAVPSTGGPWPAVVLIRALLSSAGSVNLLADRLAVQGYLALAPDHYANDPVVREVPIDDILAGIQVAVSGDADARLASAQADKRATLERVVAWWDTRDDGYVQDLLPAVAYLRQRPDVQLDAIAVMGFGGGGGLTWRLVTDGLPVRAATIFAGRLPRAEGIAMVQAAVLAHYGGEDGTAGTLPAFAATMAAQGKDFNAFVYPGAGHLFFDAESPEFDPAAADLAWSRTYAFLRARLAPQSRESSTQQEEHVQ